MHSVDETKTQLMKYIKFTETAQPDKLTYPFNLIDNLRVNVIKTKKIVDDLMESITRAEKPHTGAADDDSLVEVYIY